MKIPEELFEFGSLQYLAVCAHYEATQVPYLLEVDHFTDKEIISYRKVLRLRISSRAR